MQTITISARMALLDPVVLGAAIRLIVAGVGADDARAQEASGLSRWIFAAKREEVATALRAALDDQREGAA